MLIALGGLLCLVGFVCWIFILIHAFSKGGIVQGLLCFFIFPYAIYYAFAKFEHEKKNMIVWGFVGGYVLGIVMYVIGFMMAVSR